jgi:hypothetical protein
LKESNIYIGVPLPWFGNTFRVGPMRAVQGIEQMHLMMVWDTVASARSQTAAFAVFNNCYLLPKVWDSYWRDPDVAGTI